MSQDVIYKRSGDEINAKVLEVGATIIRYKATDNPDGPIFSILKSDVMMIKYANGTKDVFQEKEKPPLKQDINQSIVERPIQEKRVSQQGFTNLFQFGYSTGTGTLDYGSFYGSISNPYKIINIGNISGYKFNEYFSAGIGLQFDIYYSAQLSNSSTVLPVFLDLRSSILGSENSPIVYFDIGNSFNIGKNSNGIEGLLMEPGIGFKIPTGTTAVNFSLGYTIQKALNPLYGFNYSYFYYGQTGTTEQYITIKFITFKVGFLF